MLHVPVIQNRTLFVKLLLSMTAVVIVTVLLISSVTYTIAANNGIQSSVEYNKAILTQQRDLINKELKTISSIAAGMTKTQAYLFQLHGGGLSVGSRIDLSNFLAEQQKLSPYIDSIYLYYDQLQLLLSSRSDVPVSNIDAFTDDSWLPYFNEEKGSRTLWITGRANGFALGKPAVSLMQKMPYLGQVEGAVVINVKLDQLFADYLNRYDNKKGNMLVLGPDHQLLYSETSAEEGGELTGGWGQSLTADTGSYKDSRQQIITYTTSELSGWKFINITPQSVLLQGIKRIQTFVVIAAVLCMTAAIVVSSFISRRLYRPLAAVLTYIGRNPTGGMEGSASLPVRDEASFIRQSFEQLSSSRERLLNEKLQVDTLLSDNRTAIIEKYWNERIQAGVVPEEEDDKSDRAKDLLGIKLDFSRYALLTFELESAAETRRLAETDTLQNQLLKYGLIEELAAEIDGELFARDEAKTVIIQPVSEGKDEAPFELARRLQQLVAERYDMILTFGISRIHNGEASLREAYEESVEALNHKIYIGKGEIVTYTSVDQWRQQETDYYYPYDLEKKLLQALLQSNEEECASIVRQIMQIANDKKLQKTNILQLFFQLSGEVVKTLRQTGSDMTAVYDPTVYLNKLSHAQTLQDMELCLKELCSRIVGYYGEKKLKINDETLKQAISFMERQYNNNISIESVAEHVQLSSSHLSRIFKENTGMTLNDYLIHLRITKAQELLSSTACSMEEICQQIGYSNVSYFNKLFKSRTGHTPGQFRRLQVTEQQQAANAEHSAIDPHHQE